ncbi:hypothetical protein BS47DRAFT_1360987 [Hydnum rufescens UP504]|uniref:DUF4100 domain-containing protein n=1 Tax=Hydnum rufescens UP504 TaxID=1448309 RepID=A0A9P6DVJ7_9AGAM|nr:hypothetical protein BS47DRAFT_1360987 [Hydnum rufescens UP504]
MTKVQYLKPKPLHTEDRNLLFWEGLPRVLQKEIYEELRTQDPCLDRSKSPKSRGARNSPKNPDSDEQDSDSESTSEPSDGDNDETDSEEERGRHHPRTQKEGQTPRHKYQGDESHSYTKREEARKPFPEKEKGDPQVEQLAEEIKRLTLQLDVCDGRQSVYMKREMRTVGTPQKDDHVECLTEEVQNLSCRLQAPHPGFNEEITNGHPFGIRNCPPCIQLIKEGPAPSFCAKEGVTTAPRLIVIHSTVGTPGRGRIQRWRSQQMVGAGSRPYWKVKCAVRPHGSFGTMGVSISVPGHSICQPPCAPITKDKENTPAPSMNMRSPEVVSLPPSVILKQSTRPLEPLMEKGRLNNTPDEDIEMVDTPTKQKMSECRSTSHLLPKMQFTTNLRSRVDVRKVMDSLYDQEVKLPLGVIIGISVEVSRNESLGLPYDPAGSAWGIRGVNGNAEPLYSCCHTVPIEIGGLRFDHIFFIKNGSIGADYDLLMGQPWLKAITAEIRYCDTGKSNNMRLQIYEQGDVTGESLIINLAVDQRREATKLTHITEQDLDTGKIPKPLGTATHVPQTLKPQMSTQHSDSEMVAILGDDKMDFKYTHALKEVDHSTAKPIPPHLTNPLRSLSETMERMAISGKSGASFNGWSYLKRPTN